MNGIIELSKRSSKGGRRKIKMALLTIHENSIDTNLNGIHWKEEYILNNIDSLKCMSICAEFSDENKEVPFGHGATEIVEVNGVREPLFENSEVVGTIETAKIEDVEINGDTKRVLVGYGYLYNQRYPNFVNWVNENLPLNNVDSSIEIMGISENNNKIVYEENEPTDSFRTPKIFDFSATAILSIKPSDNNAIVLELNNNKGDKNKMDEKELKNAIESAVKEALDSRESVFITEINTLNTTITEKDGVISELNATIESVSKALEDLKREQNTYWEEKQALEGELVKLKVEKRLSELNEAIADFNEDEVKYAESEINSFKENPMDGNVDSIVSKICTNIVKTQKENSRVNEINSDNTSFEDIFSEVNSNDDDNDNNDDVSIF